MRLYYLSVVSDTTGTSEYGNSGPPLEYKKRLKAYYHW
jgi:hypothetical protein